MSLNMGENVPDLPTNEPEPRCPKVSPYECCGNCELCEGPDE